MSLCNFNTLNYYDYVLIRLHDQAVHTAVTMKIAAVYSFDCRNNGERKGLKIAYSKAAVIAAERNAGVKESCFDKRIVAEDRAIRKIN